MGKINMQRLIMGLIIRNDMEGYWNTLKLCVLVRKKSYKEEGKTGIDQYNKRGLCTTSL